MGTFEILSGVVLWLTLCRQLSGCDYAMEDFVKVSGRRPEEGPVPGAAAHTKAE